MLGEAKISKLLFKFSVPCVMGLLISPLYNIVDQIFIGNSELGYLGIAATLIISIVLMIICQIFAAPLMGLFGASEQTMEMAVQYFRIVAAFFPFYLLLNVMNSMIRADGSPAYAMSAMLLGAITNIILDPIFIFVMKWGIAGAAWATAIGQVASFAMCAVYFFKPKSFVLTKRSFSPDKIILRKTISMINDEYIRAVLARIIKDEEYHIMMLQALKAEL